MRALALDPLRSPNNRKEIDVTSYDGRHRAWFGLGARCYDHDPTRALYEGRHRT